MNVTVCENGPYAEKIVTWNKNTCWVANDAVGHEKQKDYVIQKANILSFQGPTALFALQQGLFLHHVTVFSEKGPLPFSP